jgi:hypothetical protein
MISLSMGIGIILAWYWIGMTKKLLNMTFCLSIYNTQRVYAICHFYIDGMNPSWF